MARILPGCGNSLPQGFTRIIRMIEAQQIDTAPWITLVEVFPTWTALNGGVLEATIEF